MMTPVAQHHPIIISSQRPIDTCSNACRSTLYNICTSRSSYPQRPTHFQHVFQQFVIDASQHANFPNATQPRRSIRVLVCIYAGYTTFLSRFAGESFARACVLRNGANTLALAQSGVKFLHYVKRFISLRVVFCVCARMLLRVTECIMCALVVDKASCARVRFALR